MTTNTILKRNLALQILALAAILILWPMATENIAFGIIVRIRTAITTGSESLLINAAIQNGMLFMIPSITIYMLMESMGLTLSDWFVKSKGDQILFVAGTYCLILLLIENFDYYPIEMMTAASGMLITLILVHFSTCERNAILPKLFISLQVFFLIQWINIIPELAKFQIGKNDLSISLKIASQHLRSNMTNIAMLYMVPLLICSLLTTVLIRLYIQNLKVAQEKHQKERAFEEMQQQFMNNRIYQEINALAHDLKTPLATIQGLISLLVLSKDASKIESYGGRIESAITKMSDMISSFLYGDARERIEVKQLIQYIQAQVPVDKDDIDFKVTIAEELPVIEVNKIRMARALVNILENAILAPTENDRKTIWLEAFANSDDIVIRIIDNGIGIPENLQSKVWEIGYSGKNTSGLGLPFAKQTVLENGGSIDLSSVYGQGTTVSINLPAAEKERNDGHN